MATIDTRNQIIELAVGMIHTAPSSSLLDTLLTQSDSGVSINGLAEIIETSSEFSAIYPESLTQAEFSERYANNMLGDAVTTDVMNLSINWVFNQLLSDITRSDLMLIVAETFGDLPSDYPDYGDAGFVFQNQVNDIITQLDVVPEDPDPDQ